MPNKDIVKKRKYARDWVSKRRTAFFKGKSCIECGESDIKKLNLHHRNPKEKESHNIWSWSKERRDEEILKCDILCKKCHTELHATLLRKHGTRSRYADGCRCDACKAKMAECSKRWRDTKKRKLGDMAERQPSGANAQ